MIVLAIGSSNLVEWWRMRDPSTNHYVNLATVTATLYDSSGSVVAGCNAIPLTVVSGADGVYQGWLPASAPLTANSRYTLQITATWGGTYTGVRRYACIAQYRGAQ